MSNTEHNQPPNAQEETDAERARSIMVDTAMKVFDRAVAFNNIVIFAGYAGAFTIWNFTREHMSKYAEVSIALLLTVSVATYVFFEVFKMLSTTRSVLRQTELMKRKLPAVQFLDEWEKLDKQIHRETMNVTLPIWRVALITCVTTAAAAIAICLWQFVSVLIEGLQAAIDASS